MVPFYGWGSIASRLEALQGHSLLFTTKFSEILGAHCIPGTYFKDFFAHLISISSHMWLSGLLNG